MLDPARQVHGIICLSLIMFERSFSTIILTLLVKWPISGKAKEILPANCDCRDWHGGCRRMGDTWTDEGIWTYRCFSINGSDAEFVGCRINETEQITPGKNQTMSDGFWASCEVNDIRQKLEIEPRCDVDGKFKHIGERFRKGIFQWICLENGRSVIGCYFKNEMADWNLLTLGHVAYVGLIRHTCDQYQDQPGLVQYHAEIRDDIPHQRPSGKGTNKLLPEFVDKRLKNRPTEWAHQNVEMFIREEEGEGQQTKGARVRYLPASRNITVPPWVRRRASAKIKY